jgi:hypothetical protein
MAAVTCQGTRRVTRLRDTNRYEGNRQSRTVRTHPSRSMSAHPARRAKARISSTVVWPGTACSTGLPQCGHVVAPLRKASSPSRTGSSGPGGDTATTPPRPNGEAQQRRGTGELEVPEPNHAPPSAAAPGSAVLLASPVCGSDRLTVSAHTDGGAIAFPSSRASARASVLVASCAGLPTAIVGAWQGTRSVRVTAVVSSWPRGTRRGVACRRTTSPTAETSVPAGPCAALRPSGGRRTTNRCRSGR